MIRNVGRLRELDERYQRRVLDSLTHREALARFESLWREAVLLQPRLGEDWLEDLVPDFAVARAVNGLPPAP